MTRRPATLSLVVLVGALLACNLFALPQATEKESPPTVAATATPVVIVVTATPVPEQAGAEAEAQKPVEETPTPVVIVVTATPGSDQLEQIIDIEEQLVTSVYERVGPAVVNITSRAFTYDFFFNVVPQEGTGSGFVYDNQGHIITNYHVVKGAEEIEVTLADETHVSATVVGVDPSNDLAVIKINVPSGELHWVELGDSSSLRVGQRVIAIGNPVGLERTLTTGVVSSLGRIIESPDGSFIGEIVQTDAAINPGNSGGPLLDSQGRLIGVNTAIFRGAEGIGFAVPVDTVKRVVPELIARGRYPHPWLGAELYSLSPEVAARLREGGIGVPADGGVLVVGIYRGGPAHQAGLQGGSRRVRLGNLILPIGGDVIRAINGQRVRDVEELTVYLETKTRVGQRITVDYIRDDREGTVEIELSERPDLGR